MKEAFIIDGIRTPIGNFTGTLKSIRTDDLGALVIKEVVKRNPTIPLEAYDDVIMGCANQAGEDNRNVARMCSLLAGLPGLFLGKQSIDFVLLDCPLSFMRIGLSKQEMGRYLLQVV